MKILASAMRAVTLASATRLSTLALLLRAASAAEDACTTIIVGHLASADGSTMTSHTNDCLNCDFRIGHVAARAHAAGAGRRLMRNRSPYPRLLWSDEELAGDGGGALSPTYAASNTPAAGAFFPWRPDEGAFASIGRMPQVAHTYAYLDGHYGIMNEHQLAIGESTCGGALIARPVSEGGEALVDVQEMTRVALERCRTAVCAVAAMGAMAESLGYYGAEDTPDEAGEALTVVDPTDAWVFHVSADDTGRGAVWAARRVPPTHVTAVANQFTIGALDEGCAGRVDAAATFAAMGPDGAADLDAHAAALLPPDCACAASANVYEVAARAGLWRGDAHAPFHFTKAYGMSRGFRSPYATRRVWRVFSLAAPSLALPAETDVWGSDYPFSVAPDGPVDVRDVLGWLRDHYEGAPRAERPRGRG